MKKKTLMINLGGAAVLLAALAAIYSVTGAEKLENRAPAPVAAFLAGVHELMPTAGEFELVETGVYRVLSADNHLLGTLYLEKNPDTERQFGYAGTIEVAVLFNADGRVAGVLLGKNQETPSFLNRVRAKQFLKAWNDLEMKEIPGKDVDAVTGATLSSTAIRAGVRKLAADYLAAGCDSAAAEPAGKSVERNEEEIARLEKRTAATRRILAGSERLLKQLETRREEELQLRLIAATQGKGAAKKFAEEKGMMYFNHHSRHKGKSPVELAAEKYRETGSDENLAILKEAIRDEYERLLMSVPPHNAEHAKALKALEARLAALKQKQAAAPEAPAAK